jgi:hypothetical protein
MLFVHKMTYLIMHACTNICQVAWQVLAHIRQALLQGLARLADIRLAVLRDLPDSPTFAKGHF